MRHGALGGQGLALDVQDFILGGNLNQSERRVVSVCARCRLGQNVEVVIEMYSGRMTRMQARERFDHTDLGQLHLLFL
jgi:hypothetical protein